MKITIYRPDGTKQGYSKITVDSIEGGILSFSVPDRTNSLTQLSFKTNMPFLVEEES
jgi:hypothetical protein